MRLFLSQLASKNPCCLHPYKGTTFLIHGQLLIVHIVQIQRLGTARQEDKKWEKLLKGSGWCDKNGLDESFKLSPHLMRLSWFSDFHIISRPDPEAGHKRDLGCQPRPIKWGLISQLSFRAVSWHPWKQLRGFFCILSSPAGLFQPPVCYKFLIVA